MTLGIALDARRSPDEPHAYHRGLGLPTARFVTLMAPSNAKHGQLATAWLYVKPGQLAAASSDLLPDAVSVTALACTARTSTTNFISQS